MTQIDLTKLSLKEIEALKTQLEQRANTQRQANQKAYEQIKAELLAATHDRVINAKEVIDKLHSYIVSETEAFREVMQQYGKTNEIRQGYAIKNDTFSLEVKMNKTKGFDERANIAAQRLVEFLRDWVKGSAKGVEDPMYQLGMMMVQRNRQGELDNKAISKLYELEGRFNSSEYSEIMQLFKESNTVESTATYYYFSERDENGVWRKIEVSFNRL